MLAAVLVAACADIGSPPPLPVSPARLEADAVITADGLRLPLSVWQPARKPLVVVVAVHGMNDYRRAWQRPAQTWAAEGIATYAFDQRGFGGAGERGRWYGAETMAADLATVGRLVAARHPGVPLFVAGESMGGAVALLAAARVDAPPLAGVVLAAPAVWDASPEHWLLRQVARLGKALLPDVTLPPRGLLPLSSDDPVVMQQLQTDPLVIHRTRLEVLEGVVDLMEQAGTRGVRVRQPILLLLGDEDRQISRDSIATLAAQLPAATVALYPSAPHLLFRSVEAAGPTEDAAAWMLHLGRPLPSGAQARGERCRGQIAEPSLCPASELARVPE
jgi:acylglycerol lipase